MAVFAHVMETLFFFGLIGSFCVVLLSAVDDARQMLDDDDQS